MAETFTMPSDWAGTDLVFAGVDIIAEKVEGGMVHFVSPNDYWPMEEGHEPIVQVRRMGPMGTLCLGSGRNIRLLDSDDGLAYYVIVQGYGTRMEPDQTGTSYADAIFVGGILQREGA